MCISYVTCCVSHVARVYACALYSMFVHLHLLVVMQLVPMLMRYGVHVTCCGYDMFCVCVWHVVRMTCCE